VTAAQVFTGNSTPDLHTLELCVYDPDRGRFRRASDILDD
jgi:hypothetical protein